MSRVRASSIRAGKLILGGTEVTATAAELNKMDGVTATFTELNYVDVTTLGTVQASKAVTADASKDTTGFRHVTATGTVQAEQLTSTDDASVADDLSVGGALLLTDGSVTGALVTRIGGSATEGWERYRMEETVDLTDAGAKFVAMTNPIPDGAIIRVAQANLEVAVTGATANDLAKVGIGINGSDPDQYGLSAALTLNNKIDTYVTTLAALSGATTLEVCACTTGGALSADNFATGSVRVVVIYDVLNSLDNAA